MILTGLIAALLLLPYALLRGPFWDGWISRELYGLGMDAFMQPYIDNGRPLGGWSHWLAMKISGPQSGAMLWSIAAIAVTAAAAHALWQRHLRCMSLLARAMALATAITPAFTTALGATMTQFFTGFALVAVGILCFSNAGAAASNARAGLLYACGSGLLLAGTLLSESGLALTVLAPLAFAHARQPQAAPGSLLWLALPHAWICVMCAVALALMFSITPAVGFYAEAHDFNRGVTRFAMSAATMVISLLAGNGLLVAALVGVALARRPLPDSMPTRRWVAAGVLLLVLAFGPYVAAGRFASPFGWGSRMLLAAGAGTALVAFAVGSRWLPQRKLAALLIACTVLGVTARWPAWASRELAQDSLIQSLRQLPASDHVTEIVLTDVPWMVAQPYRDYELTLMARQALGRQDVIARLATGGSAGRTAAYLAAHGLPGAGAPGDCWRGRFVRSEGAGWWMAALARPWWPPHTPIPAGKLEPDGAC